MAKGISIGVASDTREFSKGVKTGVIAPLEDASDALDDVARDGDKAGDKLEKAMEGAQRETEDLAKEQTELGKSMARASSDGSSALKRNMTDGTSAAKRDLTELGNEAKANAAETFSSFDGSASSFGDAIQGTLGGVVSSLGPIGAAAGAAGAIGIGLLLTGMQDAEAESEDFKARVQELGQEFIDAGGVGEASLDYLIDKIKSMATETEDGKDNLADLQAQTKLTGGDFRKLAEAYAGNVDGLDDIIKSQEKYLQQLQDEAAMQDQSVAPNFKPYEDRAKAQTKIVDGLKEASAAAKEAAIDEAAWIAAGGPELQTKADAIASIQDSIDDAAGSWEVYSDTEKTVLDPAQYLANIQARTDAAISYAANLQTAQERLSPEAYQYLVDQGIDFAPMLASILGGGDQMITDFNTQFTAAANAGNAAIDGTLATDLSVSVEVKPELTEAEKQLQVTEDKERDTKVTAKADTTTAEADLKAAAAKTYTAKITASVDTTAAEKTLATFMAKARSVTITAKIVDRKGNLVD